MAKADNARTVHVSSAASLGCWTEGASLDCGMVTAKVVDVTFVKATQLYLLARLVMVRCCVADVDLGTWMKIFFYIDCNISSAKIRREYGG